MAPNWRRWCRSIASIIWRRRSCGSPAGTRRIRTFSNGNTSRDRSALPTACGALSKAERLSLMGRYIVKVPDIGEGTTEAEIVKWHVAPGQEIREEDPLVDVMTDKATVEIPAPIAGTVVAIEGQVGEKRPVGSQLVTLDVAGAGNVADGATPAARPKLPLTPALSPPAGRGSRGAAAAAAERTAASAGPVS